MAEEQLPLVEDTNTPTVVDLREIRSPEIHYPDRTSEAAEDQGWGQRELTPRQEINQRGLTAARQALHAATKEKPEHWRDAA